MTIKWEVPKDLWLGETVAVLASGRSLTQEAADSVKHLRRIAVRRAFRLAPDADMLLALDGPPNFGFWEESRDFAGIRICGVECDELDAMYLNIPHEVVTLGPAHVIHVRNNGLAAIRVAAMTGAAKIVLLGFDPEPYAHFYDAADPDWDKYPGLSAGLAALVAELRASGIEVSGEPKPAPVQAPSQDYLNPGELEQIVRLAAKARVFIEFGCNVGKTAAAILRALPKLKQYVGIDAGPDHVPTLPAQRHEVPVAPGALALDDPRFRLVIRPHGSFDLQAGDLPSCDAVFIDGDHSRDAVLNDYALAKAITRSGGVIIFHDDNGRPETQVTQTLHELEASGVKISRVEGTWLAYEIVS